TSSSPGVSQRRGVRPRPTPAGVPVKMRSPGRSGSSADRAATRRGTEKIMSLVRARCRCSGPMRQPRATSPGSSNSSGVTTQGPVGPKPGRDLPRLNWGAGPASCVLRSDRSWPAVSPATWSQASASATCRAVLPITATSSTSQSVWPPSGRAMSPYGPVMQVAVANTPDYCVQEVAAHTIAMVMALARRLPVLDRAVRDGRWSATGDGAGALRPSRATVAVVGFGRIGSLAAAHAAALGFRVVVHDPNVGEAAVRAAGHEPVELDEALAAA